MADESTMEKLNKTPLGVGRVDGAMEIKSPNDEELEAPADFTSPEVLYQELIASIRRYHPSDDISMIETVSYTHLTLPTIA